MWYFIYNIGLMLAAPAVLLILLAKERCRRGLAQRLGFRLGTLPRGAESADREGGGVLWVHAVSLGEVIAAAPLVRAMRDRYPAYRVVVSTATETGREAVEERLSGMATHFYAPLDFPWVVARVVDQLRPSAFIFVETEIWPNLLRTLSRRRIPSILVNGRVSSRSFRRKNRVKPFWGRVLCQVSWFLMQSDRDVERITALGAPQDRVVKTGTLKFDQPVPQEAEEQTRFSRETIRLRSDEELMVAGSTRPGEEEPLLACYKRLQREFPGLVLLLAPRHVERASEVEGTIRAAGLTVLRRGNLTPHGDAWCQPGVPRVILLDTRGELVFAYREAVLAFVGGTLVPIGGHNLLEPALWGKPVFFGPHTDHCADVARLLVEAGGGIQVGDAMALEAEITKKLHDRAGLEAMGQAARRVIDENQGALGRTLDVIEKALPTSRPADHPSCIIHRVSPVRALLRVLVSPYGLVMRARALLYQYGWLERRRLPRPVISVGNLTLGGTGKTPLVIFLTGCLLAQGKRVAVLSRGYRRQSREPFVLVSDGHSIVVEPKDAGDEPYLIAQRCPGAVVAVGADRYRLGHWVLERFPIDCFLLDDGFQHLALDRDVDLLLVDASDPDGLDGLFPAGRLREPLTAVSRANALIITRVDRNTDWEQRLARIRTAWGHKGLPVLVRFTGEKIVHVSSGIEEDVGVVVGKTAVAFCGIANAESFRSLLTELGVTIIRECAFPDHHAYTCDDVRKLIRLAEESGADIVLTTEKDACKVAPLLPEGRRLLALRLGTEIFQGRAALEDMVLSMVDRNRVVACA